MPQRNDEETDEAGDVHGDVDDGGTAGGVESWLADAARISHADRRELLPAKLPPPGAVIDGKYELGEMIGEGSMGAVFSATHLVTRKPVAVKWMLRSARDEIALRRLTREAYAACRIDHPNVVSVFDIGRQADASFLVMERLRGQSLRARLGIGTLDVAVAVDSLLPAMRGVAAAHDAGVIHRDLKPDNIFLCQAPDGSPREAKVLDFGVSAVRSTEDASDPTLTGEGALLGTPCYMSPEALESATNADQRSDVYAFGVILYEALSGRLPFEAESHSALVLAIAGKSPPPLRVHCPNVPLGFESVVTRAMARAPGDRYADMRALIHALMPWSTEATRGEQGTAGVAEAPRRGVGRKWWWIVAAAIAAAAATSLIRDDAPASPPLVPVVTESAVPRPPDTAPPVPPPLPSSPGDVTSAPAAHPSATSPSTASPSTASPSTAAPPKRARRDADRPTGPPRRAAPTARPVSPAAPLPKARAGTISIDQL